jgi:hypothetical protein
LKIKTFKRRKFRKKKKKIGLQTKIYVKKMGGGVEKIYQTRAAQ